MANASSHRSTRARHRGDDPAGDEIGVRPFEASGERLARLVGELAKVHSVLLSDTFDA
jgi:hypothetical protein